MPKLRGIEAAAEIKVLRPRTKVLILTMHQSAEYFYHAISAGAEGYLLKSDADTELQDAVRTLQEGRTYISPQLSRELAEEVFTLYHAGKGEGAEPLTVRQREILKLIAEGKTNQEIADLLCISVRTVEHHRANMMKKLNLRNTAALVQYAIRKGYVSLTN
jgi:DNA-binding NarL/FixJ family response regulator